MIETKDEQRNFSWNKSQIVNQKMMIIRSAAVEPNAMLAVFVYLSSLKLLPK